MLKTIFISILFCSIILGKTFAQDTLPKISVTLYNGKAIISWKNAYTIQISNINIQRSTDSIKKFVTIGSVLNPMNEENGYVDNKTPTGKIFYRVFIAFDGGNYLFSKSYVPALDTAKRTNKEIMEFENEIIIKQRAEYKNEITPNKKITISDKKEGLVVPLPPPVFVSSKYVFAGKDNNVIIALPDAATRKMSIKFYEEDNSFLFELSKINEPYLIMDKVNFLHTGWFYFSLYENDILVEKSKFLIQKDAKVSSNLKEQRNK
jgi:hypothetical protein